ncbi:MAG: hypothetical protein KC662_01070 [Candidatus Magasanikbacteria bacterium]|nr:hypothetical protein [Candidatus Magasanikbacteria bacterium]
MLIFQVVALSNAPQTTTTTSFPWMGAMVVLVIVFLLVLAFLKLRPRDYDDGLDRKKIRATWNEIQKTSSMGLMGMKLAVIEADKLVDNVMRQLLIPGDTMGERLKMAEFKYPDIRRVWPAHKTRNMLVHDSTYELRMSHGKEAINAFEKALKLLKAL